jgi:hypothetical protein
LSSFSIYVSKMSLSESSQLFTFKPIEYSPVVANHPWLKTSDNQLGRYPAPMEKQYSVKMNHETIKVQRVPKSGKYAHVKSRITQEETQKYLERKKVRERQRIEELLKRETEEMQECTFHPVISRTWKCPY